MTFEASRIERIARAICLSKRENPDALSGTSLTWHKYISDAKNTLALHDERKIA